MRPAKMCGQLMCQRSGVNGRAIEASRALLFTSTMYLNRWSKRPFHHSFQGHAKPNSLIRLGRQYIRGYTATFLSRTSSLRMLACFPTTIPVQNLEIPSLILSQPPPTTELLLHRSVGRRSDMSQVSEIVRIKQHRPGMFGEKKRIIEMCLEHSSLWQ